MMSVLTVPYILITSLIVRVKDKNILIVTGCFYFKLFTMRMFRIDYDRVTDFDIQKRVTTVIKNSENNRLNEFIKIIKQLNFAAL